MSVVEVTVTREASAAIEEAEYERIADAGFAPQAPHAGQIPDWQEAATYASGDLVQRGVSPGTGLGQVYRSTKAGNKGNNPSTDTDYTNWQPASVQCYPLVNPSFITNDEFYKLSPRTQPAYNEPPARSDAAAKPEETVNPGSEIGLGQ